LSRTGARWLNYQGLFLLRRLFFIDESWTKTNMTHLPGWAKHGERLVDKLPHGYRKAATLLASLSKDHIDAPCQFDGPINSESFLAYV
jgi:hypothetical protein